jgi:cell division protein FtsL
MKVKYALILLVLIVFLLAGFLFFNEYGYLRKYEINAQLDSLRAEIVSSEKEIAELKAEIDSLKKSPRVQEKVAREKYNFKKPNEVVIEIEEQ